MTASLASLGQLIGPLFSVIVAGGSGSRMGRDIPKQFLRLAGKPVLFHTLERFYEAVPEAPIILVLPAAQIDYWQQLVAEEGFTVPHQVVAGGESRSASIRNGIAAIPVEEGLVATHDGVRCLISAQLIRASFIQAAEKGNAVAAVAVKDTIRELQAEGSVTLDRARLRAVQTPQTFRLSQVRQAFSALPEAHLTDEAGLVEQAGFPVHLLEGDYENLKITTPEDLILAEALLAAQASRRNC